MAGPRCELEGASVVLVGSFNPAIFQPSWLALHELLRKEEADNAKVNVIAEQICDFQVDWLRVQVTLDRFMAETADEAHKNPLRDLVLGIFTLLEHTPLKMMGLNRNMHFAMPSEEKWHAFGHLVTPKTLWSKILDIPGMRSITMQGKRRGSAAKYMQLKVEPSVRVQPGVYIQSNEHYEATSDGGASELMSHLQASWEEAQLFGKWAAEQLLSQEY